MAHPEHLTEPGRPYLSYSEYHFDIEKQNQEALRKNNEELDKLCKNSPPYLSYSEYHFDIEKQNQEALRKNNEKLNQLCKNICLIIGWSLAVCLFIHLLINVYSIILDCLTKFE